jgi:hypothetical protein
VLYDDSEGRQKEGQIPVFFQELAGEVKFFAIKRFTVMYSHQYYSDMVSLLQ